MLVPPTVCATFTCRVIGDAALRVEVGGEADVVPRQDVDAGQLELVRAIADLTVEVACSGRRAAPVTLSSLFGLRVDADALMRACENV